MKTIATKKAPKALGPYSQAIIAGDFVFCSGQIGIDPKTGELLTGIEEQTKQALENLDHVLKASGSNLTHVVKTTIFLESITDFPVVNEIYESFFTTHKPARSTIEAANLPKGALIEIEAIATL